MKHLKFSVNEKVQQFLTAGRRDKKNSENTIKQLRESLARYKADFWAPRSARVITYDAKQIDGESVASLNTKIRDFVCANQTLLNQVNFYENKINNDKTTYFKQQKKIEAFSKDNTRLREDRRQLKNSLKEKNFSLKGLVKEREKLQKELALQKDIVQRQEKRLSQFQSTIQNCARELEDEKVQKESPKKELEKVKAEVAKKDLIISSTNKALEEYCAKNQEKDSTLKRISLYPASGIPANMIGQGDKQSEGLNGSVVSGLLAGSIVPKGFEHYSFCSCYKPDPRYPRPTLELAEIE